MPTKSLFFFICLLLLCAYDTSLFSQREPLLSKARDYAAPYENVQEEVYSGPAFSVATEQVPPLQIMDQISYSTELAPYEEFFIYFHTDGYIADIYSVPSSHPDYTDSAKVDAAYGDKVKKGDILVQLSTVDHQKRIASAREALHKALAQSRQATLDLEQYRTLLESKAIARSEFDTRIEHIDAVKAEEEAARANLVKAMEALQDTALSSPIDGIITHTFVQRGMAAVAGALAYIIVDCSRMKALFIVPDWLVEQISVGTTLAVALRDRERCEGQVTAIRPLFEAQSPVFELELCFANLHECMLHETARLLLGENGLLIHEQTLSLSSQEILAVPMSALVRPHGQDGDHAVFIVEKTMDSTGTSTLYARECIVEIGRVQGDKVEILSGVQLGADVVVLGAERLFDGAPVRLLPKVSYE